MTVALMTKLDAVNAMLESVWEAPISTLEVSGVASVAMAKRVLDKVSRSVQSRGWAFNTEDNLSVTPDVSGYISLGSNVLSCDTIGIDKDVDVVVRGQRLYNRVDHTYVFTKALVTRQILLFEFEELPEVVRTYIAIQAARVFRDKYNQNDSPASASPEEIEALRNVEEDEGQQEDNNMFSDSYSVASILCR